MEMVPTIKRGENSARVSAPSCESHDAGAS